MFPAADARGRVRGFGARRMNEDTGPMAGAKYVNTSDGELYHKREVLFGIDLARSHAAKAGRMLLTEGYTDVLALHQAGIRNAVGIMGTSLTEEQISELERVVKVLELCLDADSAGQAAMLRAAELAAGRDLELRVVPLPEGSDPADLLLGDGAEKLKELAQASVPFVSFNVDWILSRADTGSAEGRDAALEQLRPMVRVLGGSVLHDDLLRRIAGRLELTFAQVAQLASEFSQRGPRTSSRPTAHGPRPPSGSEPGGSHRAAAAGALRRAARGRRDAAGERRSSIELLTSNAMRARRPPAERAAAHAAGRPAARTTRRWPRRSPTSCRRAGRVPDPSPDRLEHARLVLELERVERAIIRARTEGSGSSELAREREVLRDAYRAVVARLEDAQ